MEDLNYHTIKIRYQYDSQVLFITEERRVN